MTNTTAILTPADIKLVNCNDEWTELKQYKLINRETGEQIGWVTGHSGGTTFGTYAEWTAKIDATDTEDARFFDHSTRKGAIAGLLTAAQIPADDTDTDVEPAPTGITIEKVDGAPGLRHIFNDGVKVGAVCKDPVFGTWTAQPEGELSMLRFPGSTIEVAAAKLTKYLGIDTADGQDLAEVALVKVVMVKAKYAFHLIPDDDTDALAQQFWGALECLRQYGMTKSGVEANYQEILAYLREFDWDTDAAAEAYVG